MMDFNTNTQQNTFGYQLQPKFRRTNNKTCDLLDLFEEGIAKEKLHKIELRKDAMMLLRIKQKYDIISQHFARFGDRRPFGKTKKPKFPMIKLNNGDNLLLYPPEDMYQFYEIYEIFLEELQNCNISFFGALPNLNKLTIRFSNISLMDESEYLSVPRYINLRELNLNCNNLDTSCLDIISNMKNLRVLNLMGNFITADIPDLTKLEYLEELNLSYNYIESYFVNLNLLKDFKINNNGIISNNNNLRTKSTRNNESNTNENNKINQTEESKDEDVVNTQTNIRNTKYNDKKKKNDSSKNSEENKTSTEENVKNGSSNVLHNNNNINSSNTTPVVSNNSNFIQDKNISYNDREINAKHLMNNQQLFFNLQKYLETNIQPFFHKLSLLKNLTTLNLSHNKIHFFDISQDFLVLNKGFRRLENLDLSNNIIEDEIAILMIINLPVIKNVDVSENPLVNNKSAFEDIEYEIFKFKNILLTNRVKPRKTNKIILKDILAFPPNPYLVKSFPLKLKSKKELIVPIRDEPIVLPETKENESNINTKESNNNNNKENTKEKSEDLELPLIQNSVNPIFLSRLDLVGKSKKNKTIKKK